MVMHLLTFSYKQLWSKPTHMVRAICCVLQTLGENTVMHAVMRSLEYLQGGKLALPLTFVSALVTSVSGKQFAAQFIAAGGASPANVQR